MRPIPEIIERFYLEGTIVVDGRTHTDIRGPFPSVALAQHARELAPSGGTYVIKCYAYKLIDEYIVEEG